LTTIPVHEERRIESSTTGTAGIHSLLSGAIAIAVLLVNNGGD